jgi:hypothetical protein
VEKDVQVQTAGAYMRAQQQRQRVPALAAARLRTAPANERAGGCGARAASLHAAAAAQPRRGWRRSALHGPPGRLRGGCARRRQEGAAAAATRISVFR